MSKNKVIPLILSLLITTSVLLSPHTLFAQSSPEVVQQSTGKGFVPCGNPGQPECSLYSLFNAATAIINFFIGFAGIFAIMVLIIAGIRLVLSAGNTTATTKALKQAKNAVIGFVIVVASFLIVNTVLTGGKLGLGIRNGAAVFSNPLQFIRGQ